MLSDDDIEKIANRVFEKLLMKGSEHGPLMHQLSLINKTADDVLMHHTVGDFAIINKIKIYGPPSRYQPNPNAQGAGNYVIFYAYTFVPKNVCHEEKYPLIVFPHGGVHSNFGTFYTFLIRELIAQGYLIIAPEYRGSTGYGKQLYELIDYGGLENQDTVACRDWMVENNRMVDPNRIGIMGWSHGGLHALMNVFEYPERYQVAQASVPVADLIARMGYKTQNYRDLYEAKYHIGESAYDNVAEYKRRSPAWNVPEYVSGKYPPLLIHSAVNDQDVNVFEVEHLIKSLKEKNWDFEYKIFPKSPGGHFFSRLDTKFSKGVRGEIYNFLAKYLDPPSGNPLEEFIGSPNPLE